MMTIELFTILITTIFNVLIKNIFRAYFQNTQNIYVVVNTTTLPKHHIALNKIMNTPPLSL